MATSYSLSYRPVGGSMHNYTVHRKLEKAEQEAKRLIVKHKFAVYVQIWEHKRGKEHSDRVLKVM
jgi:hypothetical protein